jgi:hypothetical protein
VLIVSGSSEIIAIAVQAVVASQLGLALGRRISERFRERGGELAAFDPSA